MALLDLTEGAEVPQYQWLPTLSQSYSQLECASMLKAEQDRLSEPTPEPSARL